MLLLLRGNAISSGLSLLKFCFVSFIKLCRCFSSLVKQIRTASRRLSLTGFGVEDLTISRPNTFKSGVLYRTPSLSQTFMAYRFLATHKHLSAIASRLKTIFSSKAFVYSANSFIALAIQGSI